MVALLKWFAGFAVGKFIAKLFVGVTVLYISSEAVDYAVRNLVESLSAFQWLGLLVLGGITKSIGIITGAVALRLAASGFSGVTTK